MQMSKIMTPEKVKCEYRMERELGEGAEGRVYLYRHKRNSDMELAIKVSYEGTGWQCGQLEKEIEALKALGSHPNIIELLGFDPNWIPLPPALFYEFAALGDLDHYRQFLIKAYGRVYEETVWKLIVDVGKGLHHLHHSLPVSYVHHDIKPANILVFRPDGSNPDELPALPVFKVGDCARLTSYDPKHATAMHFGTPEYAPPLAERQDPITPKGDIYALGASVQAFIFGIEPTQLAEVFREELRGLNPGTALPTMDALLNDKYWRERIPIQFRPLNASKMDQINVYDVPYGHEVEPYSKLLNDWYAKFLQPNRLQRVGSDFLMEYFVSYAEGTIDVLAKKRCRDEAFKRWEEIKAKEHRREVLKKADQTNVPGPSQPCVQKANAPLSFESGSDIPGELDAVKREESNQSTQATLRKLSKRVQRLEARVRQFEDQDKRAAELAERQMKCAGREHSLCRTEEYIRQVKEKGLKEESQESQERQKSVATDFERLSLSHEKQPSTQRLAGRVHQDGPKYQTYSEMKNGQRQKENPEHTVNP